MPTVFPDFEILENAIVARIGVDPENVASVFGMGSDEMLGRKPFRCPAAAVMFSGATLGEPQLVTHPVSQIGMANWDIYVIGDMTTELRGGRKGNRGAYRLFYYVMQQLSGFEVIEGFPMYCTSIDQVDMEDETGKAAYICRFTHQFELVESMW